MLILALDTTAEFGSLALVRSGEVIAEVLVHAPEGFSGLLFGEIEAILDGQSLRLSDVDVFAAASGPGSFTGVRIGLAAIKGLAATLGKPAIAVSNLEALSRYGTLPLRATVIDARRGEVFAALYAADGAVIPERVTPFLRFLETLEGREFEWICADFGPFTPLLLGTRFETMPITAAPRAIAGVVGQIAYQRHHLGGETGEPAVIEANYVRRSDAELLWREPALP